MKAVIFDMDGVIIDSEQYWKQAEHEVFTSLGVNVIDEDAEMTKSMTTAEVTHFWYSKFPWKDLKLSDVEQRVVSRVMELIESENCEINGVKSFIERLKASEYKIGLATNSPDRIIPVVLGKLDMVHLFDTILSAEFEEKGKPDPAIYYRAADRLGIPPEECIVIEDSYSGMLAAKNAGMTVIAFTNGKKEANGELADYILESFEHDEIEYILKS